MVAVGGTPTAPVSPLRLAPSPLLTSHMMTRIRRRYPRPLRPAAERAEGPVRAHSRPAPRRGRSRATPGQSVGDLGERHGTRVRKGMDEVGFQVVSIGADGRLLVQPRGGLYTSLWSAAGLVHTAREAVPAVFEPRRDWHTAAQRTPPGQLTVFIGTTSRQAAEALGVQIGQTVTMPKRMVRLGRHRVLARSLDDRIGCTALLLALRHLDSNTVQRRLTFAWVVEEEIGLVGSRALLAATLPDVTRVYAVDTFVSSDAPLGVAAFCLCASGAGGSTPGDGQWHGGAAPSHRCRARAGAVSWYPTPVWHDGRVERRCVVCSQWRGQCTALVAWALLPFASRGSGSARHRSAGATHRHSRC